MRCDNGIFVGTRFVDIDTDDGRLCKRVGVEMIDMDRRPYRTASFVCLFLIE